ncbi:MAG: ATP-binding cassette domain-containing protein [Clostridiales bacterium]|nr:ATP-binding cassette domain-containing protein [Clostridiales bacterium]MDD7431804.1 ATP-binding cassette domain-containing protein [Clostridiales bacterium]MDY3062373.1 oligopeptide/dipeptide ABC transporter ATP-binding protein [Eubacteriales bacterium]
MNSFLEVKNVCKKFPAGKDLFGRANRFVHAVNHLSFEIKQGETFSLVGESGCGKSTTGRLIDHLLLPDQGEIWFMGQRIDQLNQKEMRPLRRDVQMIFQDPAGSLNPRMSIKDLIAEPFLIHEQEMTAAERMREVNLLMQVVGLSPKNADRYPHEFSGGQKQRIGIARALSVRPRLIIADEPVSALDVSIQAQILHLLQQLQKQLDLTYIFISHDLSVVEMISDRIAVMYLGFILELADKKKLFAKPSHPYTQALISAVPIADPERRSKRIFLTGEIPSAVELPKGCPFESRCRYAIPRCKIERPQLKELEEGHQVACFLYEDKV